MVRDGWQEGTLLLENVSGCDTGRRVTLLGHAVCCWPPLITDNFALLANRPKARDGRVAQGSQHVAPTTWNKASFGPTVGRSSGSKELGWSGGSAVRDWHQSSQGRFLGATRRLKTKSGPQWDRGVVWRSLLVSFPWRWRPHTVLARLRSWPEAGWLPPISLDFAQGTN